MREPRTRARIIRLLRVSSFAIFGGILVAGLWPFHAPKNDVAWLAGANGLRFGRHGTILSSSTFERAFQRDEASCSLELWLAPASTLQSGTLIAFYASGAPSGLLLRQRIAGLVLEREASSHPYLVRHSHAHVDDVFRPDQPVFLTVVSDGHEAAFYVNGVTDERSLHFTFSARDLAGRLVVANSPVENDSWAGELRGLAFYNRELAAPQVLRHYQTWTRTGRPDVTKDERAIGVYLFDEHSGTVIRSAAGAGMNLYIPERYTEVREKLLESPWNGYYPGSGYWKNVLMNIGGFVPLGFLFYAYFSFALSMKRAALATVLLGAVVSLTIEIFQAFLPTRDSGMTDIITNTLGTAVGAVMFRWMSALCQYLSHSHNPAIRHVADRMTSDQYAGESGLAASQRAVNGM